VRLRVVTYNVHKGVGTDGQLDLERIAAVIRHYDADVTVLQEVMFYEPWRNKRSQAAVLHELVGRPHAAVGLNCRRHFGIYGNVTFSRWPLAVQENVDLTVPLKRPRSALRTTVDVDGALLHVFNAHLGLVRLERRLQIERLVTEIDDAAGRDGPVILLGDTNDWRDRLYPSVLQGAGFVRHKPRPRGPSHGSFPSWYPVADIDRVYARGAVRLLRVFPSRLALARVASDHLPVIAEIELPGAGGT
jgi:endonuclease/exonuclease/phosphatase family metal-dependent hydrolase